MHLDSSEAEKFRSQIYQVVAPHYRHFLWRATDDPYHIFISEVMLQQTQVGRVIPKYDAWLLAFPTVCDLAQASLRDVLAAWSGLGYNRRAQALHRAAQIICSEYASQIPNTIEALDALPGIGKNTAGSIAAFAFRKPTIFIETNIRTVFLHTFFPDQDNISDAALLPLIAQTVDHQDPRAWYYALMDYGVWLKSTMPNPNRRSRHYTVQSRFEGSLRQVRGALIRCLTQHASMTIDDMVKAVPYDLAKIKIALQQLCDEQLLREEAGSFKIC